MKRFFKPLAIAAVGAGLATGTAWATAAAGDNSASAQPLPPQQVARETVNTVLARLNSNREEYKQNPQALYRMIEEVLVPHVDVEYMAKLVLGRHWRTASPEQRQRFAELFKQMVIQTYGNALYGFDKEKINYLPVGAEEGAKDITFRAEVVQENGDTVPVTLDMHVVNGQWKVYNGSVGNLSFVTSYRAQFNAQIQAGGLSTLIQKLESRYGAQTSADNGSAS